MGPVVKELFKFNFLAVASIPHSNTYTNTYRKSFQTRDRWSNMTPIPLGLFVKKLQIKVGLAGYERNLCQTFENFIEWY